MILSETRPGWKIPACFILDELHKMKGWKNYLKGVYDTKPPAMMILVTGSDRLEAFRQRGDSLAGRFFRHRLLPFSPAEAAHVGESVEQTRFLVQGGFPEPFLSVDTVDADRWRLQYTDGLIRTDILNFERIHDFRAISTGSGFIEIQNRFSDFLSIHS